MAENIWEQAVETYLAIDRGLFLNSQYLIGTPGEWEAYPDFLAICFPDKTAWMVEVTTRAIGLNHKINEFAVYAERIQDQLVRHCVIPVGGGDWKLRFWAFAPERDCEAVRNRFKSAGTQLSLVTPLEVTMNPSLLWERFRQ